MGAPQHLKSGRLDSSCLPCRCPLNCQVPVSLPTSSSLLLPLLCLTRGQGAESTGSAPRAPKPGGDDGSLCTGADEQAPRAHPFTLRSSSACGLTDLLSSLLKGTHFLCKVHTQDPACRGPLSRLYLGGEKRLLVKSRHPPGPGNRAAAGMCKAVREP